ncbi:BNR-4 repeat-containing protein [Paraferrimonas sp. SM1919]|uniref:CBM96 family carbohydrate-binding protein n=1 Tax=Paraferrimonas sp. SM1919 TaxID=2662263 RepID=UPI0013D51242|nr:BNR-4 repeat-containing protein [Paraferrimonas sp. SM1919]
MKKVFLSIVCWLTLMTHTYAQTPSHLFQYTSSTAGQPSFDVVGDDIYILYTDGDSLKARICHYHMQTAIGQCSNDLFDTLAPDDNSHNQSAIAVDGNGYIHAWVGMHNHKMKYYRSNSPHSYTSFTERSSSMPWYDHTGVDEKRYTYPHAVHASNGDVFFIARRTALFLDGSNVRESQRNEKQDLYHWNNETQTWTAVYLKGSLDKNAYMSTLHADKQGNLHIATAWSQRHSGDNTFQRGTYVRYNISTDKYYKADGTQVSLPIDVETSNADHFYPWEQPWGDDINEIQTPLLTTNIQGQPIVAYPKNNNNYSKDNPQYGLNIASWDGNAWQTVSNITEVRNHERPPISRVGNWVNTYSRDFNDAYVLSSSDHGFSWGNPQVLSSSSEPYAALPHDSDTDLFISTRHLFKVDYQVDSNQAPTVMIAEPASAMSYPFNVEISLMAEANDEDGYITQVQFFANDTLIGTDLTAPYETSWNNAPLGNHLITAVATDNQGLTTRSTTVNISVVDDNPPPTSDWIILAREDFESGLGLYTDGGSDVSLYKGGNFAYSGNNAVNIQDNSGANSTVTLTNSIDVSSYSEVKIDFAYYAKSMDNSNEDFFLEFYDGSSWQRIGTWAYSIDFDNDQFFSESVTISGADYHLPNNLRIRFICDASGNSDDVFIDDIIISANNAGTDNVSSNNVSISAIEDAFVRDGIYADNNYNTSALVIKGDPDLDWTRQAFLKFDIASLPANITQATLILNVESTTAINPIAVAILNSHSWDESDLTWNNAPNAASPITNYSISEIGVINIDITSAVQAELGSTYIGIKLYNDQNTGTLTNISSAESANPPSLVVSW